MENHKKSWLMIIAVTIFGGLIPILLYYFILGDVPTVDSQETLITLNQSRSSALLIDVREPEEFKQEHIDGAMNWPLESITKTNSIEDIPANYKGNTLFFICNAGFASATATRHLIALGVSEIFNVQGGMQEWVKIGANYPDLNYSHFISSDSIKFIPFHELSMVEQIVPIMSGFFIKPTHMLLSLIIFLMLRKKRDYDLVLLRWGVFFFLLGETFCAINYIFFKDDSFFSEYLHNFGMMIGIGFIIYALFEGMDKRIIKLSAEKKPCSLIGLCEKCNKNHNVPCKLKNLFLWVSTGLAVISLLPLLVKIRNESYMSNIFDTLHQYTHLAIFQYYEFRYIPALAFVFFIGAIVWQIRNAELILPMLSRILFSLGSGALLFSFFRLLLGAAFINQQHWSDFWEETTELMLIVMIALILWYFREHLLNLSNKIDRGILRKQVI